MPRDDTPAREQVPRFAIAYRRQSAQVSTEGFRGSPDPRGWRVVSGVRSGPVRGKRLRSGGFGRDGRAAVRRTYLVAQIPFRVSGSAGLVEYAGNGVVGGVPQRRFVDELEELPRPGVAARRRVAREVVDVELVLPVDARTTISLIWVAASVTLASRITGFHARVVARTLTAVLLLAAVVSFFVPLNGAVTNLHSAEAWWGGTFTVVRREPSVWLGGVYVAVAAAFATPSFAQNAKVQEAAAALGDIQKDKAKLKT